MAKIKKLNKTVPIGVALSLLLIGLLIYLSNSNGLPILNIFKQGAQLASSQEFLITNDALPVIGKNIFYKTGDFDSNDPWYDTTKKAWVWDEFTAENARIDVIQDDPSHGRAALITLNSGVLNGGLYVDFYVATSTEYVKALSLGLIPRSTIRLEPGTEYYFQSAISPGTGSIQKLVAKVDYHVWDTRKELVVSKTTASVDYSTDLAWNNPAQVTIKTPNAAEIALAENADSSGGDIRLLRFYPIFVTAVAPTASLPLIPTAYAQTGVSVKVDDVSTQDNKDTKCLDSGGVCVENADSLCKAPNKILGGACGGGATRKCCTSGKPPVPVYCANAKTIDQYIAEYPSRKDAAGNHFSCEKNEGSFKGGSELILRSKVFRWKQEQEFPKIIVKCTRETRSVGTTLIGIGYRGCDCKTVIDEDDSRTSGRYQETGQSLPGGRCVRAINRPSIGFYPISCMRVPTGMKCCNDEYQNADVVPVGQACPPRVN